MSLSVLTHSSPNMSLCDDMPHVQWSYLFISSQSNSKGPVPSVFIWGWPNRCYELIKPKPLGGRKDQTVIGLMDSGPIHFFVSQEEFNLFHRIDRELYKILVINLYREPAESMQVLAMWLWLEKMGYRNLVKKITSLPNILINEVAEETVTCLNCINNTLISSSSSEGSTDNIPLLQSIMEKEISLPFLYENRVLALEGVAKVVRDVCIRAFTDIMQQAIIRNTTEKMVEAQKAAATATQSSEQLLWFGSIGPSNLRVAKVGGRVQNLTQQENGVPADERTLFVTFSKGYRVEEWEVKEFFTMAYGDCVEALYMQEVQPNEQALFARIVFHKISTIEKILRGSTKAKFTINGKHVWARKFVPKRTKTFLPTTSNNLPGESSAPGNGI